MEPGTPRRRGIPAVKSVCMPGSAPSLNPDCGVQVAPWQDVSRPVVEYWLHWPGIAVSNRDLTAAWCEGIYGDNALYTLRPRNSCTHVPMYGCAVEEGEAPFVVRAIVDDQGEWRSDWTAWLRAQSPNLSSVFHIGHNETWPTRADDARVRRLLPLLCSINPLGTPCRKFLRPASAPILSHMPLASADQTPAAGMCPARLASHEGCAAPCGAYCNAWRTGAGAAARGRTRLASWRTCTGAAPTGLCASGLRGTAAPRPMHRPRPSSCRSGSPLPREMPMSTAGRCYTRW